MLGDENDPVRGTKGWFSTFTRGLAELGWTDGRNLRMDVRWDGDDDRTHRPAKAASPSGNYRPPTFSNAPQN
jgi:hypothetical protein